MEKFINVKSVYDSIDEINMRPREKAAAKARMRDAEVVADVIWRVSQALSGLGRLVGKLVRSSTSHILREGN